MLDCEVIRRIRTIFLYQAASVSIADTALLLGWPVPQVIRAIKAGEIEAHTVGSGRVLPTAELVAKALEVWTLETIEQALGQDAALVLPPLLRTREVVIHLPAYQVRMVEYLAQQRQITVAHLIVSLLEDLASERAEELSASIPGFDEAIRWPDVASAGFDGWARAMKATRS